MTTMYTYELKLAFDLVGSAGAYTRSFLIAVAGLMENVTTTSPHMITLGSVTFAQVISSNYIVTPIHRTIAATIDLSSLMLQSIAQAAMASGDLLQNIRVNGNHINGCGVVSFAYLLIQGPNVTLKNGTSPVCLVAAPLSSSIRFDLLFVTIPTLPNYMNMTMAVPCTNLNQTFLDFKTVQTYYVNIKNDSGSDGLESRLS